MDIAVKTNILLRLASKQAKACAKASVNCGLWHVRTTYACIGVQHVQGMRVALFEADMWQSVVATLGVLPQSKETLKCGQVIGDVSCM